LSRRVGPAGVRAGATQRLNAGRGRPLAAVSSGGRPHVCPQPWTEVDTREALVEGGSCRYPVGDRGRLVEKLSPGMCTGWGDLVAAGSPEVTDRPVRRRDDDDAGSTLRPLDIVLTCVYARISAVRNRSCRQSRGRRGARAGNDLGIQQGDAGDSRWTTDGRGAQPSRCPRVDTGDALTTHSRPTGPFRP
jgi:hypothetical protein